jgi:hypothetical protein
MQRHSVRGRQREAQAASHTCRIAGGQELLSRHTSRPTSRKARTGRHAGSTGTQRQLDRQKRQGSTVREVSGRTQRRGEGREAGRHRLTEGSRLEAYK